MTQNKQYFRIGHSYKISFESKKQQNLFNKQFDLVMDKAYFDGCNYEAMKHAVAETLCKHFNIPFESL